MPDRLDAIVVGAGPNGLAAAIALAREGRSVLVLEAAATIGGGTRTEELTLPRYRHDVCSAVHPLALASPFLRSLPLADYGLRFVHPPLPLAHPLDDGTAVALHRSVAETAAALGSDGTAYHRLFDPLARDWEALVGDFLAPPIGLPRHPLAATRFGALALRSAAHVAHSRFDSPAARALLAGNAAHSMLPVTSPATAAFALLLPMLAHAVGWPIPIGGSQAIADAMTAYLRSLGGEIVTERPVQSLADLPSAKAILLDLTPQQVLAVAGSALTARYRHALGRYRYGPGVFKVDYALSAPVPWTAEACRRAGTVHVGGSFDEIAASEQSVADGQTPTRPFVLVAQQSLFDDTRTPDDGQTLWAYCHVPNGSTANLDAAIDAQVERFAPGFGELVLARHAMGPAAVEAHNPNYVGGDINGGRADLRQLLARPVLRRSPYRTSSPSLFLCSSSTPPGGGVHGLCGWFAARAALRGALR